MKLVFVTLIVSEDILCLTGDIDDLKKHFDLSEKDLPYPNSGSDFLADDGKNFFEKLTVYKSRYNKTLLSKMTEYSERLKNPKRFKEKGINKPVIFVDQDGLNIPLVLPYSVVKKILPSSLATYIPRAIFHKLVIKFNYRVVLDKESIDKFVRVNLCFWRKEQLLCEYEIASFDKLTFESFQPVDVNSKFPRRPHDLSELLFVAFYGSIDFDDYFIGMPNNQSTYLIAGRLVCPVESRFPGIVKLLGLPKIFSVSYDFQHYDNNVYASLNRHLRAVSVPNETILNKTKQQSTRHYNEYLATKLEISVSSEFSLQFHQVLKEIGQESFYHDLYAQYDILLGFIRLAYSVSYQDLIIYLAHRNDDRMPPPHMLLKLFLKIIAGNDLLSESSDRQFLEKLRLFRIYEHLAESKNIFSDLSELPSGLFGLILENWDALHDELRKNSPNKFFFDYADFAKVASLMQALEEHPSLLDKLDYHHDLDAKELSLNTPVALMKYSGRNLFYNSTNSNSQSRKDHKGTAIKVQQKTLEHRDGKDISTSYWYEDSEMRRILDFAIAQHDYQTPDGRPIHILGPLDNISPYGLIETLNDHQRQAGVILIPFNLGLLHWVGLILEYNANGQLIRADYYDSIGNKVGQNLNWMLSAMTNDNDIVRVFTAVKEGLIWQENGSGCGPCTVENLLAGAEYQEDENTDPVGRRLRHLQHLEAADNNDFYDDFYNRQQLNQSSFSQWKENNILSSKKMLTSPHLSSSEYKGLLQLAYDILIISNQNVKQSLINALQPDGTVASEEHASQIARIRAALSDGFSDASLHPVIERFFCISEDANSLEGSPLKINYNYISKLGLFVCFSPEEIESDIKAIEKGYPNLINRKEPLDCGQKSLVVTVAERTDSPIHTSGDNQKANGKDFEVVHEENGNLFK